MDTSLYWIPSVIMNLVRWDEQASNRKYAIYTKRHGECTKVIPKVFNSRAQAHQYIRFNNIPSPITRVNAVNVSTDGVF